MDISTLTKKIIDTGTFITFEEEPTTIGLPLGGGIKITLKFTATEDGKSMVTAQNVTENELEINLVNTISSFGGGNLETFEIGKFDNKKLYINIRVFELQRSKSKTVHYTFYLDK